MYERGKYDIGGEMLIDRRRKFAEVSAVS